MCITIPDKLQGVKLTKNKFTQDRLLVMLPSDVKYQLTRLAYWIQSGWVFFVLEK